MSCPEEKDPQKQQSLLASIVNSSNDSIISINNQGTITSWNPSSERIFGYSAKETVGKHISILYPSHLKNKETLILEKLSKVDSGEHYETERLTNGGNVIFVSVTISPIKDEVGNIIGASQISSGIALQKVSEEKLRVNEQHLSEAQSIAKVGSWETDLQTFNVNWSEETHHIFETNPEKFHPTHESFLDFVHPEERNRIKSTFQKSLSSQTVNSIEHRIFTINGTLKYVIEKWKIFHNRNGDPVCAVGTCQDISEQKKAEENLYATSIKLERANNDLNKIFDSSLDVICTINSHGEFVTVSAASQSIWGYSPQELIGVKYMELVFEDDKSPTMNESEKIVNGSQVTNFENRYIHKNGKLVSILWSANWDEKLQLMFCIAKDVTEKKRLEKAIETERDQFFEMFLNAPSSIALVKGPDHVFEMANPPYLKLIGKKEIIGKTVKELFPEVIEQGFIKLLDHVYTTGETYIGNEVLLKLNKGENGEQVDSFLNFIYQAYRDNEGNIAGVFGFTNDVTEQILSRKKIEKSEKFFKGVIENSTDMISIFAPDGKMIYASPAISKTFGYTNEECLSLNIADIIHIDDALTMHEFMAKIMQHPEIPLNAPLIRNRKKDGSYIWLEGTLTNFLEMDGINAIVANFRDVTERRKADQDNRFKVNLLNTIGQAAISTDLDGVVNYWNKAAENIYGWTAQEAIGQSIMNVTPSYESKEQAVEIMNDLKKGYSWTGEFKGQRKDGTIFPAFITNSPIYDNKNILTGIIGISSDITEKKKADEENRFKVSLLNTIGQAAIATDLDGVVNYWNKAAEKIYGWTSEEAIGKKIVNLTPSYAYGGQSLEIVDNHKIGSVWSGEVRVQRKDGTNFPALVTDSPIYDEKNKLRGMISISSDITEKKKLQELFDKASSLAVLGSYDVDLVANTLYWSSITKQIHEVDESFIPDLSTAINFYKEGFSRQSITESFQKTMDDGVSYDVELQIITAKGNERWVRAIGEGEFLNGKCVGVHGSFQDITEQKNAEEKVIQLSERLQLAAQAASVGIWDFDILEDNLIWDDNMYKLHGTTRDKFPRAYDAWIACMHPDDLFRVMDDLGRAISGEKEFRPEFRVVWPDKSIHYIKANALIKLDEMGDAIRMTGTNWNITEQKELELQKEKMIQDLIQRNKTMEQFSYIVSHNLRSPVANILGLTNLLEKRNIKGETRSLLTEGLSTSAKKLDEVIHDLNYILNVKTQITEKKERVSFSSLVTDIQLSIESIIANENAIIECDFSEVTEFLTIKSYLYSIFYNLISNSIKFKKRNDFPVIKIKSQIINNKIVLIFKDNGLGIDLERQKENLFGLYKRFHIHAEGKGMGLFMIKTQVEAIGGSIIVKSEVNIGTEFTIEFPK
ncbi:MAG: PAS domain S-box protein [Bacteroidota bacterium]